MHTAKTLQSLISKSAHLLKYASCSSNCPVRVSILGYDCCVTKWRPHDDFFAFCVFGSDNGDKKS